MTNQIRTGILALAVAFSAGIHAALVPEHLKEMPPLGYAFIVAAVIGGAIAAALMVRPRDRRIPLLAGVFCVGQIVAWGLFVTIPVPLFSGTPEPIEMIALVSKAAELVGLAFAIRLGAFSQLRHVMPRTGDSRTPGETQKLRMDAGVGVSPRGQEGREGEGTVPVRLEDRLRVRWRRATSPGRTAGRLVRICAVAAAVVATAALPGCATHHRTGEARQSRREFPVAPTFRANTGKPLREPRELRSHNGFLRATLPLDETDVDVAGARVRGKVYGGSFPGPTLRVWPGDTLELRVVNRLGEPTNLHEHGFHVSPIGISDNVLRTLPGRSANSVRVRIPRDMSPGTYWYHAHLHALVEEQVFSGLSGVIIVDGLVRRLARDLRRVPDHLIALKDLQVQDGAIIDHNIDSNAPTTRTVNGQLDPVLRVQTNRTQLLRLANISADIWYRLALDGARFHVIGEDANPVGQVWRARELVLPPGKRYDVLVRWPRPGTYRLLTLPMSTGPGGDTYPGRELATIRVGGPSAREVPWPHSLGPLPRFDHAHVDRVRHLTFSEDPAQSRFLINGRQFDATRVDQVVRLGATEEWVIRNTSREQHPFHLHVDDFQVIAVNGRPYHARSLQDTVPLPVGGEVRIRMRFRDYLGAFVYHCHILAHEDAGMMGVVEVTRTGRHPSVRTLRELRNMHAAMTMAGHHSHLAHP